MELFKKKRISFSIFSEADYSTKQFSVSQTIFLFTLFSVFSAVCLTGFIAAKCNILDKTIPAPVTLQQTSSSQQHLITEQARQINLLNEKLNGLKEKFDQLQNMKTEICQIGRIEQPVNHENLFGIGGSRAEYTAGDTDTEKNNNKNNRDDISQSSDKNRQKKAATESSGINSCKVVLNHSDLYINPIACIPSSLPANGQITKETQQSISSFTGENIEHRGIMLKTDGGGEVTAPANGIISFVDTDDNNGGTVIIDHGHGYITRYACLKSITKKLGDMVFKGDVIGNAKTDPAAAPSQFYYEIILNGLPVNPEKYTAHDPFLL